MVSVLATAVGLFGSLIGSFLNVVIFRVPEGRSVVAPRSACGNCGNTIRARDNIPVLSWLLLRGRCRDCRTAISIRYPLVELGVALLFAVVAVAFGPAILAASSLAAVISASLVLVAFLYFAAISVSLAMIDLDTGRLPNVIVLPAYVVGFGLLATAAIVGSDWVALIRLAIGTAVLGLIYFVIAFIRPGGMGFGDVKLAGVIGMFLGYLGWQQLIVGGSFAFLLGGLFAVGLLVSRKASAKSGVPFGPWMLLAAWIGILAGAPIASGYLSLFGLGGSL